MLWKIGGPGLMFSTWSSITLTSWLWVDLTLLSLPIKWKQQSACP